MGAKVVNGRVVLRTSGFLKRVILRCALRELVSIRWGE